MPYDQDNIFAKILRGEIPCDKVYEDNHVLSFKDISPQAPVHIIVIPKGEYVDMNDFSINAEENEIVAFFRAVGKIAKEYGVDEAGYRLISNCGAHGGQEVPHLHFHLLGGHRIGPMVSKV